MRSQLTVARVAAKDDDNKWYRSGLHFECEQCGGCCGGFPGYVWVTPDELAQISEFLKISSEQFQARYLTKVRQRMSLIEKENYDCIFLNRNGDTIRCQIYPVRPRQCRTWPFWRANLASPDTWNEQHSRCKGINRGKSHTYDEIDQITNNSPC
jgi:hypothetical protein